MTLFHTILQVILLILVVLTVFNIIIFVHELGHFWAAKWRGLQIDRFQIWFGKPIWSKTHKGVQYGLGWIPAGGFVALPQMAPMEALEGGEKPEKPLPPISAMDKIIVAFAGPLFSMLLALLCAVVVWKVGKPADFVPQQVVGYLEPGSPAAMSGMKVGDKIIAINGEAVNGFAGSLNSISERIILSRGDEITYTIERPGEVQPTQFKSGFVTEKSQWFQRRGLRKVGIEPAGPCVVGKVVVNSPAAKAGLAAGDRVVSIDGNKLYSLAQFSQYLKDEKWKTVRLAIETNGNGTREVEVTPKQPLQPADSGPKVGILWDDKGEVDIRIVHPQPIQQVKDSLKMMWVTITSVKATDSSIGVDHLSGPVGIGKMLYSLLQMDDGWRRILAFMVLFNVNLAVLNMMPFPVLDGGHITLAILEKIFGRPVKARPLEILQTVCALALISLMLFVTSKDIGDGFGRGSRKQQEIVFPAN
ncbi:MAG: RIP metalloprotease RseP [Gloeobacteraceae cyanobacterium ES-bin-144]|nr:RIP metalloprotease RseP [Verrucomicrobiales bacterium]